jgi:hypothetical protein
MPYESDLPKVIDNTDGGDKEQSQGESASQALLEGAYDFGKKSDVIDGAKQVQENRKLEQQNEKEAGSLNDLLYRPGDKEITKLFKKADPTEKEIVAATEKLDDAISPLVGPIDRKLAHVIGKNVLEGDAKGLADALEHLKDDPKRMEKFIEEMNHNFKEVGAGVSMAVDSRGNVLVYKNHGKVAVEIDPDSGNMRERPISVDFDGNVILQPGEVLNSDPARELKNIGNSAVRNINEPFFHFDPKPESPHIPHWPHKPWGKEEFPIKKLPLDYYPEMKPGVMYDKGSLPQIELL